MKVYIALLLLACATAALASGYYPSYLEPVDNKLEKKLLQHEFVRKGYRGYPTHGHGHGYAQGHGHGHGYHGYAQGHGLGYAQGHRLGYLGNGYPGYGHGQAHAGYVRY